MKKTALQIYSAIGLVILIAGVSSQAQTRYRADIPFDFAIGQKSYKAGKYFVESLNSHVNQKPIAVRDAKGSSSHMVMMTIGEDYSKVDKAKLVFVWNATQYSLSVIRTPDFIVKLPKSRTEKSRARNQNLEQKIVALRTKN